MLQRLRSHKVQRLLSLVISVVCVAAVAWWVLQQDAPTWPDDDHPTWIAAALLAAAATYMLRGATARRREQLGSVVAERVLDAAVLAALFVTITWVEGADAPVGQLPATLTAGGLVALAIALAAYMAVVRFVMFVPVTLAGRLLLLFRYRGAGLSSPGSRSLAASSGRG